MSTDSSGPRVTYVIVVLKVEEIERLVEHMWKCVY